MGLFTLVGALFVVVGGGFGVLGVLGLVQHRRFGARAARTQGRVVGVEERRQRIQGRRRRLLHPVVRFRTDAGQEVTVVNPIGTTFAPSPGQPVDVLYDPDRPADARLDAATSTWFVPTVMLVVGIGLFCMGALFVGISLAVDLPE